MKAVDMEAELLAAALTLPEVERQSYLERACAGNERLRVRMKSLLEAFSASGSFLEELPNEVASPPGGLSDEPAAGDQIGNHRIVQELGAGGCGIVYLAEQLVPVKREVALKVIKVGMDTRAVVARFAAERQALALMNHPNIAQVLDAGTTPAGRPYFVMELVRGIKITEYCAQARLDIGERLALFIQVCQAIQHAHQKGIIHRDIKPSNVLVTQHAGARLAKVIDFGIAKAMQGRLTDQTVHTAFEQFIGTPAYVSPEQVQLGAIEVDTRSDIYSLGVLLYELLTGHTPFNTHELARLGLEALKQRIREEEPPTPSKRLSTLDAASLSEIAGQRQLTGDKLIKLVQRDLDWIAMRCLEKDPAHRYQTAHDLVLDLDRYLRHEPVIARPPSPLYALRKFARRHRAIIATGAATTAALLIATAVSTWMAVQANRAQQLAKTESANRQEIIDFLQNDLLAQASPENNADRDLKLRTVLDRASAKIEGKLAAQPLVEADIRETLARTYNLLGEYANARTHLQAALDIRRRELGGKHLKTLSLMSYLADVKRLEGNHEEAEALATQTLAIERRVLGSEHLETLSTSNNLVNIYISQGRLDTAAALIEQTLPVARRIYGPENPEVLKLMGNLATAYHARGDSAQGVALQEQVYAISQRVLGPEHPHTLVRRHNLAHAYHNAGRLADAVALERTTIQIRTRTLGPKHPDTLMSRHNLATHLYNLGELEEAESIAVELLQLSAAVLGEKHLTSLAIRSNLARIYRLRGRLDEAFGLAQRTVDLCEGALGARHPGTLSAKSVLARLHEDRGALESADALLQEVVARAGEALGAKHPLTLDVTDQRAGVLLKLQRYDAALDLSRRSLAARQSSAPEGWRTFNAKSQLGAALAGLGRVQEAKPMLLEADAGLAKQRPMIPASSAAVLEESAARVQQLYRGRRGDRIGEE